MTRKQQAQERAAELGIVHPADATAAQIEALIDAAVAGADQPADGDADAFDPAALVEVRWINPQPVLLRLEERIVGYGDTFVTSAERLAADENLIAADESWTPDPAWLPADTQEA